MGEWLELGFGEGGVGGVRVRVGEEKVSGKEVGRRFGWVVKNRGCGR
jgi:hypothetical protein